MNALRVTLTNRWAVFHCEPDEQACVKKFFRYQPAGSEFSSAYKEGGWDGYKNLMSRGRVASGLFLAQRDALAAEYELHVDDKRVWPGFRDCDMTTARDYQFNCVENMVQASNTGGIVLAATGVGKTFIAAKYFSRMMGTGLFVVDELTLMEQQRLEIEEHLGERVGIVGGGKFSPKRITVATVQTLARARKKAEFRKWFERVEVIIIDEVHVAINRRNIDVIASVKPFAVFGMTATIELQKEYVRMPIAALCGPTVFTYSIQDGTDEGHLVEGIVGFVAYRDTLKGKPPGYWTKARHDGEIIDVFVKPWSREAAYRYRVALSKDRNDCIEALVREGLRRGHRVIVLVEHIDHLRVLSRRMRDITHRVLSGDKKLSGHPRDRIAALHDMDAGKIKLLLASRVFGKGVNVRTLSLVIDGSAMPGRNGAMQRYGRGVRTADGKKCLLYLDISDKGRFGGAAEARERALLETGAKAMYVDWCGDAACVFDEIGG